MSDRDEFSPAVKRILAERAGNMCSFPNCNNSTSGPSLEDPTKSIRNGNAAHITAAAEGGPRYDPQMTPEQRRSIDNGIWMCPSHANLIDKEKTVYSPEQIRQWKDAAESKARIRLEQMSSEGTDYLTVKDKRVLAAYSSLFSFSYIQRLKSELFGAVVDHDVTAPIEKALDQMKDDPAYIFQNPHLESIRHSLNESMASFFRHFAQNSGGNVEHWDYIDMALVKRDYPREVSRMYDEIYKTQDLARNVADVAVKLLEIHENN